MQSRKKWKDRYYKERDKVKEQEKETQNILTNMSKLAGFCIDIQESQEEVINYIKTKIEKNIEYLKKKYMNVKIRIRIEAEQKILYEILNQLEGEKE